MYRAPDDDPEAYLPSGKLDRIRVFQFGRFADTKERWVLCYEARIEVRKALVRMVRHRRKTRASECTHCGRTPGGSNTAPLKICNCKHPDCARVFCNSECQRQNWSNGGKH